MRFEARQSIIAGTVILFALAGASYAQQRATVEKDVVFVPTPEAVVDRMLEMAQVSSDQFVIDLGSGDGRIAIAAARDYGARALGIEIDPELIAKSEENSKQAKVVDKVEFRNQNLFETDFSGADVLTMYLLGRLNMKLRPVILEEMRPGTRVVSHAFDMNGWEPDEHATVEGRNVYMWVVPAKVEGTWKVQNGDRNFTIELSQEFQEIDGSAVVDGRTVPLQGAGLTGDDISFVVELDGERKLFRGRVEDDRIVSTAAKRSATSEREATDWQARRAS